jgi:hypothetical protein
MSKLTNELNDLIEELYNEGSEVTKARGLAGILERIRGAIIEDEVIEDDCSTDVTYTGTMPPSAYKRRKPDKPPIPDGVPCWAWQDSSRKRFLRLSNGKGNTYPDGDWMESVELHYWDHMRPVCFPDWDDHEYLFVYLMKHRGVWTWSGCNDAFYVPASAYWEERP